MTEEEKRSLLRRCIGTLRKHIGTGGLIGVVIGFAYIALAIAGLVLGVSLLITPLFLLAILVEESPIPDPLGYSILAVVLLVFFIGAGAGVHWIIKRIKGQSSVDQ